jgi:hypothetical protein
VNKNKKKLKQQEKIKTKKIKRKTHKLMQLLCGRALDRTG